MTINSVIVPVSSIRTQSTLSGLAGSNASFVSPLTNDCSKDFSMSVGQDRSKSMDPVHLPMHTLVSLVLGTWGLYCSEQIRIPALMKCVFWGQSLHICLFKNTLTGCFYHRHHNEHHHLLLKKFLTTSHQWIHKTAVSSNSTDQQTYVTTYFSSFVLSEEERHDRKAEEDWVCQSPRLLNRIILGLTKSSTTVPVYARYTQICI